MTTKVSTKRHYEVCVTLDEIKELAAKKLGVPVPADNNGQVDTWRYYGLWMMDKTYTGDYTFTWEEEVNDETP